MKIINLSIILLIIFGQTYLAEAFIYRDEEVVRMISKTTERKLKFNRYLNNSELFQFITDLNHEYPELTSVYEIGRSSKNQSLKVLSIRKSISTNNKPQLKPAIKLLANQYGNEALGRQLLIYLVQVLLENHSHNELIRHLIDTIEIHVLFSMNPDGFDLAEENDCNRIDEDSIGKFPDQYDQNSHAFFDPNKTDGFINLWLREGLKFSGQKNSSEKTEPEVEAVEKWTLNNQFLISLNLRSGLEGVFYPFSNVKQTKESSVKNVIHLTPDNELFEMLAYSYAFNHPSMNISECNPFRSFSKNKIKYPVINSAFFAQINGSMEDYNYFFANCFELTVFQSCCAYPPRRYLEHYWRENKVSLINHLRLVHMGIKGIIQDSTTKKPLEGVFVHVKGNSHITISNKLGEYFRLLPSGKYEITFELNDYENVTQTVLVGNLNDFENITQSVLKNDQFYEIGVFNITMQREIRKILKEKAVQNALMEETKNCLNKTFNGKYAKIENDFESMPVFKYHNYSEMIGYLFYYNQMYPNITHLYRIGSTDDNSTKLPYVLVISKNAESHELLKPEFKYSANSFGDHWIGKEMLLLLIKHLLESYGKNEEITKLIDTTRIHILASLDPEAFEEEYAKYNSSIESTTKQDKSKVCVTNATKINSIDLTFPDVIKNSIFTFKEEERVRILSWIDENVFILSGTLYDGQLLARLPFNVPNPTLTSIDETTTKTSDDKLFKELAKSYVEKNEKMKRSKGCPNDPCTRYYKLKEKIADGIINGADWKLTQNTYQDYNYLIAGCFDLSFFISCERQPSAEKLFDYWIQNRRSLVNFIGQVHRGVKGLILDEQNRTMNNIELMVDVEGNEKSVSIYTKGDYFRLLKPGQYNLSISIQNFYTVKKQITVESEKATICNFVLKRDLTQTKKSNQITPAIRYLENRVSSIYKKCKNCGKKSNHFVKYSVIFLILIALVAVIVYYGQQTATKKLHLRRGFQQLLNNNYRSDDSSPLDSEMTLSKIAIVKGNHTNQTNFSSNSNQKNLSEDNIILLDAS